MNRMGLLALALAVACASFAVATALAAPGVGDVAQNLRDALGVPAASKAVPATKTTAAGTCFLWQGKGWVVEACFGLGKPAAKPAKKHRRSKV